LQQIKFILLDDANIFARIIDWRSWSDMETPDYYIEILDKENYKFFNRHWIDEDEIERKLTPNERKDIKLMLTANKYNL